MTTYALRRQNLAWPKLFQRVLRKVAFYADVFAESQEMQRAAHRRRPFFDY